MGIRIGEITGREITTNRDGTTPRVMLQVRMSNADDIQTVELVTPPGYDANPIDGSSVYVLEVGPAYKIGFAVNDGITPDTATGEKRIYSLDDAGAIQAFIKLLKTGIIEINGNGAIQINGTVIELNGNADFAVRFDALQTKLTALEAQLLTHIHPGVSTGSGNTGVSVTVFDIDISGAKVNEVKLP